MVRKNKADEEKLFEKTTGIQKLSVAERKHPAKSCKKQHRISSCKGRNEAVAGK
jgi:hypothetical protein